MSGTRERESISPGTESDPARPGRAQGAGARREEFDQAPKVGDVLADKYEVQGVLGAGGMGIVVSARHLVLGHRVAVKLMRGAAAIDRTAKERFLREARASLALSSEHVAKVLDAGTLPGGEPFIVMEYLAGRDLADMLRQNGPLPIPDAVGAVLQACEAIAEAHEVGIVHRDLKPSNLFAVQSMDGVSTIKVLDFGISKMASALSAHEPGLTASGSTMGSPGYMSPEQVRSSKDVDGRSDIWALGVILYELITGTNPFVGESLGATFAKIISESPPPVRTQRPDVPEDLEAVDPKVPGAFPGRSRSDHRRPGAKAPAVRANRWSSLGRANPPCVPRVSEALRQSGNSSLGRTRPRTERSAVPDRDRKLVASIGTFPAQAREAAHELGR